MGQTPRQGTIVATLATVQFVNILDFMIVMPMGPDFAASLDIPLPLLGLVGGSYTAAAAVSGAAGAFFLDRFDRRRALLVALAGLFLGTLTCAAATGLRSLVAARVLAGLFGGPATSLTIAIVADVVPDRRRGWAMGILMSAFSVASVVGVPAGLELARLGGWRLPFLVVAGLGLAAFLLAMTSLPPMREHLGSASSQPPWRQITGLLSRPIVLSSLLMTTAAMMGGFLLIPHLATWFMENQGLPRERLGLLYLVGGLFSFVAMRVAGPLIDRIGAFRVGASATGFLVAVIYAGFYTPAVEMPLLAIFVGFMLCMSTRNVAYNTLTSRVPLASERARFMSIRSAVQHLAASGGAILSTRLLTETPDGRLAGMSTVATVSMALALLLPFLFWTVENGLARREAGAPVAEPSDLSCETGS